MTKKVEMRLGDYWVIGRQDAAGIVTVRAENVRSGWIDAEMTLGGDDADADGDAHASRAAIERSKAQVREAPVEDHAEYGLMPADPVQVEPHHTAFPPRPGMKRSAIGPGSE